MLSRNTISMIAWVVLQSNQQKDCVYFLIALCSHATLAPHLFSRRSYKSVLSVCSTITKSNHLQCNMACDLVQEAVEILH